MIRYVQFDRAAVGALISDDLRREKIFLNQKVISDFRSEKQIDLPPQ